MKNLKSILRFSVFGSVVAAGLLFTQQVQAAGSGICWPTDGTVTRTFDFTKTYDDPALNVAGRVIENAAGSIWDSLPLYPVTCDCPNPPTMFTSWISARSQLPLGDVPIIAGGKTLQPYNINEFLAVAAEVWIAGNVNDYAAVPFNNVSNKLTPADFPGTTTGQKCSRWDYGSGSKGKVHLRFRRAFVGTQDFGTVPLINVYISSKDGVSSPQAAVTIMMTGSVTVPQKCDINPQAITIDFGDIMSNSFKTAGVKPEGFNNRNQVLTLACRNVADGVKINLLLQAVPDARFSNALQTDNSDIAVRIEDANGNIISPSSGRLPVNMNYTGQIDSTGSTEMNVYPISTTGKAPAVGQFNATATIDVEIQ
ncbi:fimbrial protein [Serratia aquatilis]|uniref:Fimbrial protein n=1 Tax=Serratia aquatilis TaxID=1737515 RepID=A0ABV6EB91_9GAMM